MKLIADRNILLKNFHKKNLKIAELGVFRGDFSKILLDTLQPEELFLVDIFPSVMCSGDKDGNNMLYENLEEYYPKLLETYKDNKNVKIVKSTTQDFLTSLPDNFLDIVYIDADHSYEGVKRDLELSLKKVKPDGIIAGHDYLYMRENDGVSRAVDEFCKTYNRKISILTEDGCPTFVIYNTPKINVSLVTACKDRNNCLEAVLPSWLQHNEITEVIIVDWSSKNSLQNLTKLDTRIKVIRVEEEEYYIPSQANNIGVKFATGDYILRVDTDYFLNPYYNFFDTYKIDENSFVCGDPENSQDRENNPYYKYLFGLLYITRNNFNKINGYNENIGRYYSHEDKDIFERLKLLGLQQIKLKNNHSVIHIPHSDKKRYEHFQEGKYSQYDEYTTVETHIGKNLQIFNLPQTFYVPSVVNWQIINENLQYIVVKKIVNKLQGLPLVNCISLEESTDRRQELLRQFNEYNIKHVNFLISKRFAECNDVVTGDQVSTLSDGHKGCSISHLKMIKNWYENTSEPYGFFCEDDLSLETVQYWNFTWNKFIDTLPKNWECVQLLYLKDEGNIKTLKLKTRDWDDWAVTCYVMKRSYAKKIIDSYIKENSFHLQVLDPDSRIQPLIENILFTRNGPVHSIALFTENTNYSSTFCSNPEHNLNLHNLTHVQSCNNIINMWKNNKQKNIVDFFTFFEPLGREMLELRINMLKNYVDEFVICESNKTQSGQNISYKLKDLINELKFNDINIRIIELQIPEDENLVITEEDRINCYENNHTNITSLRARARERLQKDALLQVIDEYNDDTVFIHSDIDEIINPDNIEFISNIVRHNSNFLIKIPLVHLEGRGDLRVYHKDTNSPKEWTGMFMATKQHFKRATPTQMRSNANNPFPVNFVTHNNIILKDLGWHFSWMGDASRRKVKSENFTHYDDTFSFLTTSKYKNTDTQHFHEQLKLKEGEIPPSGDKTLVLRKYPVRDLPKNIFTLSHIQKFLLPETEHYNFNKLIANYALDIESPENNFYLGYSYYQQGHTAPALSYFLRCAERTDDILLAYEALIFGYLCYKEQKIRDETAKSLIMHAVCIMPERPEARWILSVFYEQKQHWMYAYYHANRGLETCDNDLKPMRLYKDYPGRIGLLFQKAIVGYWWGKNEESKDILLDLYNNYQLTGTYLESVKSNLKKLGVEVK